MGQQSLEVPPQSASDSIVPKACDRLTYRHRKEISSFGSRSRCDRVQFLVNLNILYAFTYLTRLWS